MDLGLKGKVALVTGAGSPIGFGRAIAITLAKEGCDIIANDINLNTAEETAAQVRALGCKSVAVKADITKSIEVNAMVKAILEQVGKIDILINNAGTTLPMTPFVEQNEADWDKAYSINLKGPMICAKAVLPGMLQRKSGKIVNISSGGAILCHPKAEPYVAAKAGVIAFTKSLGLEVIGSGINVNGVAPGLANTNLGMEYTTNPDEKMRQRQAMGARVPIGRLTTTQDIANMVAFLVSDVSGDIVGKTFGVDGGDT